MVVVPDIRQVVKDNLDIARRVLFIFELKKRLDELPRILPRLSVIRDHLSQRADEIKNASLPLVLVFTASCLEHYLREKTPTEEKEKLRKNNKLNFYNLIEHFRPKMGDKLTNDAHEIRIKRNVILHKAGIIDKQASEELKEIGLTGYSVGAKLTLTQDEVRRHIDTCEKICDLI